MDAQRPAPPGQVLDRWDIRWAGVVPACHAPGSPERCLHRWVMADRSARRFILEKLDARSCHRKTVVARRIDRLAHSGLAVTPYCRGIDGGWIQKTHGACWQVIPYVAGIPLDRTAYWEEAWRGEAVGRFLIDLHAATRGWEKDEPPFSLPGYIDRLMVDIGRRDPQLLPKVEPLYDAVRERLYPVIDDIPLAFCHGDPHPLNTIWGETGINTVIDWEFCGWKPRLYDAALVVGCVGAEDADAREGQFISALLHTLHREGTFSENELTLLPFFVPAVRFAWLSEWLRKKDREMIAFELFYMRLMINGWK